MQGLQIPPLCYNIEEYNSSGLKVYRNNVYDGVRVSVDGHTTMLTQYEVEQLQECLRRV